MRSATKQARGSSIIVPTVSSRPPAGRLLDHALDQPPHDRELLLVGHERDHHLEPRPLRRPRRPHAGSPAPASRRSPGGALRAAGPASRASGWSLRARAPARGCARAPRGRRTARSRPLLARDHLDGGQELVKRRVEQADRDRSPPSRNIPSKSSCWSGSSRSSASRRSSPSAMIIPLIFGWRSEAMNMCSVRQSPIPSAPNTRARLASPGVSAFVRTPSLRRSSAQASTWWNSGSPGGPRAARPWRSRCRRCRRSRGGRPRGASFRSRARLGDVDLELPGPATQGFPMPRATSAAWLALPPPR